MKKIMILLLVLSLATLCACRNSIIDNLPDSGKDPSNVTDSSAEDPTENATIEWETPIDIDDSFQQETEDETDTTEDSATEPEVEEDPTTGENDPTQPSAPTDPVVTEPDPTDVEPTKPNGGSKPIELPEIAG